MYGTKLWGTMPGVHHLVLCAIWKAHKERGKGPGETKRFSTQGLLIQRGCRCAAVAKEFSAGCFHVILLQLPKLTLSYSAMLALQSPLWLAFNGRSHDSMTHCQLFTSKRLHTSVLFLVSNMATEIREKDFWESYFQPYRFQILPCFCLRREQCADFKSHSLRWFREKYLEFWLLAHTSPNIYTFPICPSLSGTLCSLQYLKLWGLTRKC